MQERKIASVRPLGEDAFQRIIETKIDPEERKKYDDFLHGIYNADPIREYILPPQHYTPEELKRLTPQELKEHQGKLAAWADINTPFAIQFEKLLNALMEWGRINNFNTQYIRIFKESL